MAAFFENLGRRAGRALLKGRWIFRSLAGDDARALAAEYAVGCDLARDVCEQMEIFRNDELRGVLTGIGRTLGRRLSRPRKFTFGMLAADQATAFALPGGFVFVSRGILALAGGDRDELAFLLGHEMGHVVLGHALQRIMLDSVMSAAIRAGRTRGLLGAWLKHAGARMLFNAYSHEQEADCDRFAVLAARGAGFEPAGAVRLLEKLARLADDRAGDVGRYLATHPPFAERIRRAKELIKNH